MKYILLITVVIFLTGCNDEYAGKLCKTANGEILELKAGVGDTYFIRTVDMSQYKAIEGLK